MHSRPLASNPTVFNQALRFARIYHKDSKFCGALRDLLWEATNAHASFVVIEHLTCANEHLEGHNFSMLDCAFLDFQTSTQKVISFPYGVDSLTAWMYSTGIFAEEAMLSTCP